jgi:uncharacterized membrane protein
MWEEDNDLLEEANTQFPDLPITAMAHFYRGEMQRVIAWRRRLDSTINWAVAVATATLSIAFSGSDRPAVILLLGMALVLALLGIESRRYRYYDLWRARVRMLEAGYLAPLLDPERAPMGNRWRELLNQDLLAPAFKVSRTEAIGRRFMRGHVYFMGILVAGWCLKLIIHPQPLADTGEFFQRASLGIIPGEAVTGLILVALAALLGMGFWFRKYRRASGRAIQPIETVGEWGI